MVLPQSIGHAPELLVHLRQADARRHPAAQVQEVLVVHREPFRRERDRHYDVGAVETTSKDRGITPITSKASLFNRS